MQLSSSLAIDPQSSIQLINNSSIHSYTPYGYHVARHHSLLAFAGECQVSLPRCYLLGNGKRAYGTVSMRFHSPDTLSPFGRGGPNAYCYCKGDPVNHVDRDGHSPTRLLWQGTGLVWGTVGMLSALNKASRTIVKRSVAKAKGMPVPAEFDASSRTNNALVFNGGLVATLTKVPGVVMAYAFPAGSLTSEAASAVGIGGASFAGVGKLRQLYSDMKATYQEARLNRIPLGKLAVESMKEATGWNRLRGRESAILEPLPEKVLLVRVGAKM
ncbi:RHS repeat-associated core domain-containing protein [Pseudomonas sp. p21]|uniref:RHS repeat-associated core domain-containing protein n=1 Tax=Pseudomonas sp. p21 TaxID=1825979 RepID=UPI0009ED4677|nr:RHS repeat-associated core domain-containing protein [Pseudomonas sp. p21]